LRLLLYEAKVNGHLENLKRGLELAARVLAGELQCQHIPIALQTLLLRSQMYAELGEEQNSIADVAKALELAEPEGYISSFAEEGKPIADALAFLLTSDLLGQVRSEYVQEILAAFLYAPLPKEASSEQPPAKSQAGGGEIENTALVEPLTPRELEVLRLIAEGDSNRTIAEKLVITVSAVKKHCGNIYGKLNVNSRTQAVARARQLGLLPPGR
jgi:ATP/maltotriose-dependent transcriptional regulator MalT